MLSKRSQNQTNALPRSSFRPPWIKNADKTDFFSIGDYIHEPKKIVGENLGFAPQNLEKILELKKGETIFSRQLGENNPIALEFTNVDLHEYTLAFGRDDKGIYTEIYDVWDFDPKGGYFEKFKSKPEIRMAGKILPWLGRPIQFYDRIYWEDNGANENELNQSHPILNINN